MSDVVVEAYSAICDVVERVWHDAHGTPLDPNDGLRHTSDTARAAANQIMAIIEVLR